MSYTRWKDIEELHVQKTPLGVSGIVLALLKDYFANNSQQFKYSNNPTETRLLLDLHQQWKPENCENYPGVYIKRNNWMPRQEGQVLGDFQSFEHPTGVEYWVPVTCSLSVICIGKQYGELELLLNDIGMFFTIFRGPIEQELDFNRFQVMGISGSQILHEDKNYRVGQVDLGCMFNFNWMLTLEKPLVSKIVIDGK